MASRKNVRGKGIVCTYCGKDLDYIWVRSNVELKMHFCCPDHSRLWREENNFYSEMGKSGQQMTMDRYKETWQREGFYKQISEIGKKVRSKAVAQSNKEKPRRRRRDV